ncbi:MAG: UDP-N-acetylmuramoyl-tripeptide--D-alanyl-D-alanine ligase, partial [Corynebacterium sp.]|nr:UDP-N-acetylmuramoyl-tripeptide--D-alanyl-D-alanine ligase [Corynebacterium sp.]
SAFRGGPGQRGDGHDFVPGALRDGAALVMVGRPVGAPSLLCTDESAGEGADSAQRNAAYLDSDPDGVGERVLTAVGRLARYNTDTLVAEEGLTVVGVTGSAGKTSTKDLLGAVLTRGGETVAPPGSFNNEIGHPYTALKAGRDTRFLVAEMSARGQGHIAHLARIAPPRVGVVLNVGTAHLGEFGSREAIARAKGELVESLPSAADGGLAVLNADDDFVSAMRSRTDARIVRFSMHGNEADYSASDITLDEVARASFTMHHPHGEPVQVTLGVFGAHQVSNALAAAAVGMESGLDAATVAGALNSHVAASENRMDVRTRADGVTVINDTYNANPDSMRAGVDALAYTATGRPDAQSWAVLGQMGELGDGAREEHALLGEVLAQRRIGNAVVVGNGVNQNALAESAEAHGVSVRQVENADAAVNFLDLNVGANDVVLVKASYADGLWSVAEGLFVGEEESR